MKNRNLNHKDEWETPQEFFDELNKEFNFDVDLACTIDNCKTKEGFVIDQGFDGLKADIGFLNSRVWCNPPYSRKLKEAFIRKCYQLSLEGCTCVMLLPVATSTKIFHEIIYPHAEIRFIKGRLRFKGINTFGKEADNYPMHDSMVVIFSNKTTTTYKENGRIKNKI